MTIAFGYITFPDKTTATFTPETRIIVSPEGVNVKHLKEGTGPDSWYVLPTDYVGNFTLQQLLDVCIDGDTLENRNFIAVDTIVLTDTSTFVSTCKVRRPIVL
jgi:hypothetical protein